MKIAGISENWSSIQYNSIPTTNTCRSSMHIIQLYTIRTDKYKSQQIERGGG